MTVSRSEPDFTSRQRRTYSPEATRDVLLRTAFECLIEVGYARTTTSEVCRRADAPRGTVLHHYRTKNDLVLAAMEHVMARLFDEYERALQGSTPLRPAERVDLLWRMAYERVFYAWLELAVAARTDAVLRKKFRKLMERFYAQAGELSKDVLPDVPGIEPRLHLVCLFANLTGLAVENIYGDPNEVKQALSVLRALAESPPTQPLEPTGNEP